MIDLLNEKIIVVDTETTNSLDDPICYDVGFAVVDVFGNVYERYSYVVSEIFLDEELMASAYFIDKIPQYWAEIKEGKRTLAKFSTIRFKFADTCKKWNVRIIAAHNARFDYRSLNLTQRFLTSSKYRYFFPFGLEIWDTLKMSREVLNKNDEYGEFCYNNDFLTKRLCKRFTAEIIFRFLTGCLDFEEAHTGLEDVMIEKEIFSYCVKAKPEINGKLWGSIPPQLNARAPVKMHKKTLKISNFLCILTIAIAYPMCYTIIVPRESDRQQPPQKKLKKVKKNS